MLVNFPIQPVWNTLARRAPTPVKRWYRRIARPADFALEKELERLESFPRYVRTTTNLLGSVITMVDSPSFLAQYGSIFRREKYRFRARRPDPTILDCGANMGMMTIYWKRLYPLARITAFEPDPDVFSVLSWNITQLRYPDVVLHQCAIWTSPGEFAFWAEGADAGRLMRPHNTNRPACLVEAVRLRDYLDSEIDMLKLDIEGAEV